jgi:NTE family protein
MKQCWLCIVMTVSISCTSFGRQVTYKNLVLEGAGIRGLAYTGAFEVLDSLGILKNIERVGGTSAGAIQAALLAVGYTPAEITQLTARVPWKRFNDGAWLWSGGFRQIGRQFGWYKGDKITRWIEELIAAKTGNGNITFDELHRQRETKGYKDVFITGTDLTYQCLRVFSYEYYPSMRIKDAVHISLAIPLYFKAVLIDDTGKVYNKPVKGVTHHVMVDGGLLSNYPLFIFDSTKYVAGMVAGENSYALNPQTLGLMMELPGQIAYSKSVMGNYPMAINNLNGYLSALYHTLIDKPNPEANGHHTVQRTITISNLNISPRIRKLPEKTITALLQSGKEGVRRFFKLS